MTLRLFKDTQFLHPGPAAEAVEDNIRGVAALLLALRAVEARLRRKPAASPVACPGLPPGPQGSFLSITARGTGHRIWSEAKANSS